MDEFREGLATSIILLVLGVVLQAFSAFADTHWLSSTLPIFSLLFGITGVLSVFSISEKGYLYVGGWTFVSVLLFVYGIIGAVEFLTDIIPIVILIIYGIYKLVG